MTQTGLGYDVHAVAPDRRLRLGGVDIPSHFGLAGHSDADVLLHAIMDALLGAAGMGDIGMHFPPSDERWRDADSRELLAHVAATVKTAWVVVHVDATVIADAPRIGPFREAMQATIAGILGLNLEHVNVKATTNEGLGFVGRGEGIAALAIATLEPRSLAGSQ